MTEDLKLAQMVHDVANAMSARREGWVLAGGEARRGFGVDMRSRDGEIVNFQYLARGDRRLLVEGTDPLTTYPSGRPITVAASRGAVAIAREIGSRLLPGYREALAARRAKEAQARAAFEARASVVNAAEALFGSPTDFGGLDPSARGVVTYRTEARLALRGGHDRGAFVSAEFARVAVTGDGSLMDVEMKDIPREVVMRMLAVLAEHDAALAGGGTVS